MGLIARAREQRLSGERQAVAGAAQAKAGGEGGGSGGKGRERVWARARQREQQLRCRQRRRKQQRLQGNRYISLRWLRKRHHSRSGRRSASAGGIAGGETQGSRGQAAYLGGKRQAVCAGGKRKRALQAAINKSANAGISTIWAAGATASGKRKMAD